MITNAQLKQAAREAYAQGLLTAQAPNEEDRYCLYTIECKDGKTRHCAVGAALAKFELAFVPVWDENGAKITKLSKQLALFEDGEFTRECQARHDEWCNNVGGRGCTLHAEEAEQEFLALINT